MATLLKFVLGGDILQFDEGASYPAPRPIEKLQVTDRSAGGELKIEILGIDINSRTLNFTDMLKTDHDNLKNWFDVIANGSENSFEFTDERGFVGTVVIRDTVFNFVENDFELFNGSITLEYQK